MKPARATLDITREVCPMTYVRVKLKLETLDAGDELVVRLKGSEPERNVPANAEAEGHAIVARTVGEDGVTTLILRVGASAD